MNFYVLPSFCRLLLLPLSPIAIYRPICHSDYMLFDTGAMMMLPQVSDGLRINVGHMAICGWCCRARANAISSAITGASLTGKSTILLKLLEHIPTLFNYDVDRVVLFYSQSSPLNEAMAALLHAHRVEFRMHRYGDIALDIETMSAQFRQASDTGYTLVLFEDCSQLVDRSAAFNHLIHVARHSGLLFVLLIHGLTFNSASARTMVRGRAAVGTFITHCPLQIQAVRYMIFTISPRAKQMITQFAQRHANKATVCLSLLCVCVLDEISAGSACDAERDASRRVWQCAHRSARLIASYIFQHIH